MTACTWQQAESTLHSAAAAISTLPWNKGKGMRFTSLGVKQNTWQGILSPDAQSWQFFSENLMVTDAMEQLQFNPPSQVTTSHGFTISAKPWIRWAQSICWGAVRKQLSVQWDPIPGGSSGTLPGQGGMGETSLPLQDSSQATSPGLCTHMEGCVQEIQVGALRTDVGSWKGDPWGK